MVKIMMVKIIIRGIIINNINISLNYDYGNNTG